MRKEELCSISWSFPLRLVSTHYMFLWMCGESWLATNNPTTPVLKAGLSGLPFYNYMLVCLSGLWLGGLPYLSFLSVFLKLVCYMYMYICTCVSMHTMLMYCTVMCVCVCVEALVSIVMCGRNLQCW